MIKHKIIKISLITIIPIILFIGTVYILGKSLFADATVKITSVQTRNDTIIKPSYQYTYVLEGWNDTNKLKKALSINNKTDIDKNKNYVTGMFQSYNQYNVDDIVTGYIRCNNDFIYNFIEK